MTRYFILVPSVLAAYSVLLSSPAAACGAPGEASAWSCENPVALKTSPNSGQGVKSDNSGKGRAEDAARAGSNTGGGLGQ